MEQRLKGVSQFGKMSNLLHAPSIRIREGDGGEFMRKEVKNVSPLKNGLFLVPLCSFVLFVVNLCVLCG